MASECESCHICKMRDAVTQDGVCSDCDDKHPRTALAYGDDRNYVPRLHAEIERLRNWVEDACDAFSELVPDAPAWSGNRGLASRALALDERKV